MLVVTSDRGRNALLTGARAGEDPSVKHTHTHGDTAAQTKKRTLDRDQVVLGHVGARDGALALGTEVLLNDPFLVQMPRLRADHRLLRHLRGNCTEHRVCRGCNAEGGGCAKRSPGKREDVAASTTCDMSKKKKKKRLGLSPR